MSVKSSLNPASKLNNIKNKYKVLKRCVWPFRMSMCLRVLRDHLFCSRPRPRQIFFETNTKRCLDFSFLSRLIPRLFLILETIQDQYQESWLWTCSRPIPIPGSLNQWVYVGIKMTKLGFSGISWNIIGQGGSCTIQEYAWLYW